MGQNGFVKNISGTACVIGIALSTMSLNSTPVVNGNYKIPDANYSYYNENTSASSNLVTKNVYIEQKATARTTRLEEEANALFGTMRDATPEERASVDRYIKSISKDTWGEFLRLMLKEFIDL